MFFHAVHAIFCASGLYILVAIKRPAYTNWAYFRWKMIHVLIYSVLPGKPDFILEIRIRTSIPGTGS